VQALDWTQPMLPLRPGLPERQAHGYRRHGTISLFAALDIATGWVTHDTRERHTGADFLAFFTGEWPPSERGPRACRERPRRSSGGGSCRA